MWIIKENQYEILAQGYLLKGCPWTRNVVITWELVRDTESYTLPIDVESAFAQHPQVIKVGKTQL